MPRPRTDSPPASGRATPRSPPSRGIPSPAGPPSRIAAFLRHEGGPVLLIGAAWTLLVTLVLGLLLARDPARVAALVPALIGEITFGKEATIPAVFAAGEPAWVAVGVIIAWDWILLFVGLGVFLLVRDRAEAWPVIGPWIVRREREGDARGRLAKGAGATGLALTPWLPFSPAGALTASIVGVLLGYRARALIPPMIVSTLGAATLYSVLGAGVIAVTGQPPAWLGWGIAGACLTLLGIAWVSGRWRAHTARL